MQEFTVTYYLSDEEVQRLQKIAEKFNERSKKSDRPASSIDQWFNAIMFSSNSVNEVFKDCEELLGLGEHMEEKQEEGANGKPSILEKLSDNRHKVDSATHNEHQQKEHQNER